MSAFIGNRLFRPAILWRRGLPAAFAALCAFGLASVSLAQGTIGGVAGYAGGAIDELLSRLSDFVLVLPATYVVLALRAVMPLVLPARVHDESVGKRRLLAT